MNHTSAVLLFFTSIFIYSVDAYADLIMDDSIPSIMQVSGNGTYSMAMSDYTAHLGEYSLELKTTRVSGPNYATITASLETPIRAFSFALYDEHAGEAPFYMYFYAWGDGGPLAWQDRNLSDNVLFYGGLVFEDIVRTEGWHVISGELIGDTATYHYDGVAFASYTSESIAPLTVLSWTIDSASGGTYSMYIDALDILAVPEPTTLTLVLIATLSMVGSNKLRRVW